MYKERHPFLVTQGTSFEDYSSAFGSFFSNGTYLRDSRGRLVGEDSNESTRIWYFAQHNDSRFTGCITDDVLVRRIVLYKDEYYNKYETNCSAFAHFLTTGNFVECDTRDRSLVLRQNMRPYTSSTKVRVGDMVCLMYARDKSLKSRCNEYRNLYLKAKKERHITSGFGGTMALQDGVYTAEQVLKMCKSDYYLQDYHFMVCVDINEGQPVWLSQRGYSKLDSGKPVPFSITRGLSDAYLELVPMFALIKRRRR